MFFLFVLKEIAVIIFYLTLPLWLAFSFVEMRKEIKGRKTDAHLLAEELISRVNDDKPIVFDVDQKQLVESVVEKIKQDELMENIVNKIKEG